MGGSKEYCFYAFRSIYLLIDLIQEAHRIAKDALVKVRNPDRPLFELRVKEDKMDHFVRDAIKNSRFISPLGNEKFTVNPQSAERCEDEIDGDEVFSLKCKELELQSHNGSRIQIYDVVIKLDSKLKHASFDHGEIQVTGASDAT